MTTSSMLNDFNITLLIQHLKQTTINERAISVLATPRIIGAFDGSAVEVVSVVLCASLWLSHCGVADAAIG
jgi:hypothetical protein